VLIEIPGNQLPKLRQTGVRCVVGPAGVQGILACLQDGIGRDKIRLPDAERDTSSIVAAISKNRRMPLGGTDWTRLEIRASRDRVAAEESGMGFTRR